MVDQMPRKGFQGKIYLMPLGNLDPAIPDSLLESLEKRFGFSCSPASPIPAIEFAYDSARNQYLSTALLREIAARVPQDGIRALGIVEVDLFVPGLNFVFGEATMHGKVAVISLYRLDPRRYGNPANPSLFGKRALKEAVHELGHTFGLEHCKNPRCVMYFSNSLPDSDRKESEFCPTCSSKLR